MEIWKDVVGYEGIYQVSNLGRIKSMARRFVRKERISKGWDRGLGYKKVRLFDKLRNFENIFVHRLVASHFIKNPNNKPEVNHIDSNPSNNYVDNLEWCTHSENMKHAAKNGRMSRHATKKVIDVDSLKIYESVLAAAKSIGQKGNYLTCRLIGRTKNQTPFIFYNEYLQRQSREQVHDPANRG